MPRDNSRPEAITTPGGIRIVGAGAAELVARAAALPLDAPNSTDVIWAARMRARPRIGGGSAVPQILDTLSTILRAEWDATPQVTRTNPFNRPPGKFQGISWDTIGETGAWRGELLWRHPHPVLAGIACLTHLVIDEQQQIVTITLRVAVPGGVPAVRGYVGAGQSRPPLLDALRLGVTLTFDNFEGGPAFLDDADIEPFVRNVLLNEQRTWPVALLTPVEDGIFLLPPMEIATELFGLAPLYVINRHASTFRLTDSVGDKRLSAYWGALRIYRPEFSLDDRPEDHWLLLRELVEDPLERALLYGRLGQLAAARFRDVDGVAARRPVVTTGTPVPVPTVTTTPTPETAALPSGAPVTTIDPAVSLQLTSAVAQLGTLIDHLTSSIDTLVSANQLLADELNRMRTSGALRASGANALERRLGTIEQLLRPAPSQDSRNQEEEESHGEEDRGTVPTLADAVRHAEIELSDALLILDSAVQSAADSPYEDVDRVTAILAGMAMVARRRQDGALGTGLRAAFQEFGLDYRAKVSDSTGERMRRQYHFSGPEGQVYDCVEHIAVGGTYDPKYCLRIYFTSRGAGEPRFVIGHVGRHLQVKSTT